MTTPRFNPCYLGCCSESQENIDTGMSTTCFNPCYLGCCSESVKSSIGYPDVVVSILVILDVALKAGGGK